MAVPIPDVNYKERPPDISSTQFKVRGNSAVNLVFFTRHDDQVIELIIGTDDGNTSSVIQVVKDDVTSRVKTANHDLAILSPGEDRSFWVSWYGNAVCAGRSGEEKPFIFHYFRDASLRIVKYHLRSNPGCKNHVTFTEPEKRPELFSAHYCKFVSEEMTQKMFNAAQFEKALTDATRFLAGNINERDREQALDFYNKFKELLIKEGHLKGN